VARSQVLSGYATPFVNFLQNSVAVNDAQNTNDQTAPYWSNTIAELNRYVQFKEPNGQVAQIDTLFLKQLPALDPTSCGKTPSYVPVDYGNDLFSSRRKQIDEDVRWRCEDNRNAQGFAAYRDLSQRFNRELAGRYPFGDAGGRDASPSAVRAFFADYETQRTAARQALAALSGTQRAAVQAWFDQLDTVAAFFHGTLSAAAPSQPVQLTVAFNVQTPVTHGAEQLVSWSMTSGARTIGYPNRPVSLDWPYGQPLVVDLAWANRSQLRPIRDPQQTDLRTDGATASFTALGDWALLRLAETHRPQAGPATDAYDPNRILLEFRVPVVPEKSPAGAAPADTARVHLGIDLATKDPKTQAPLPLTLPAVFPRFAPNHEELTWTRKSRN
jgi:type VI secretion system protein ImpL